jgi:hypothetical protein
MAEKDIRRGDADIERNGAQRLNNDASQNDDQNLSDQTTETGNQDVTCESFQVAWDGDKDPMCPRSMSRMRKWFIVSIACVGSLCV